MNSILAHEGRCEMGRLFGTDGIRGRAGEYPVTGEMANRLGAALVQLFPKADGRTKVVIGRDTRESGVMLERALCEGLMAGGAEIVRLGVVPTPAVAVLVRELGADAAVMLTASHNPFQDNGMKIFGSDGYKLPDEMEQRVEDFLLDDKVVDDETPGGSVCDFPGALDLYVEVAKASIAGLRLEGLKIVLDAGNGAGAEAGPRVFRELGAEVVTMATEPDGRNINAGCGALYAAEAGRIVREVGADFGVSLDGDADRVIFTGDDGEVVSGDRALALCALNLKNNGNLRRNTMVATVMSNLGLDEAMEREGISVIRAGVGDRQVLERMRADGFSFGGENSGHLIFSDYATTGDGILSALQVCAMIKETGRNLTDLAGAMREYPSVLLNLPVRKKPKLETLPRLTTLIAQAEKTFGQAGRQLVRYSGTENIIRVLIEHSEEAVVTEWIDRFKQTITEELG